MISKLNLFRNGQPLDEPIQVRYMDSFFSRLRGYMFRKSISIDEGIVLVQPRESIADASIHMLTVFMDLGVVWMDASQIIVDKVLAKSWRPFYFPQKPAKFTLEVHPDRLAEFHIGDKITFIP